MRLNTDTSKLGPGVRLLYDLTVYLPKIDVEVFDRLIDVYTSICPSDRLKRFKISELLVWSELDDPILTESAKIAAQRQSPAPYFEATRNRIREGRSFEARYWDGASPDDPGCTWSFEISGLRLKPSGLHVFVRLLLPLDSEPSLIATTAMRIANLVPFTSGHGGFVFGFDPRCVGDAFTKVRHLSKRYWGVDIENLNLTLPLMKEGLKPPCWLYMLGKQFEHLDMCPLTALGALVGASINGQVCILSEEPSLLDRNRQEGPLESYLKLSEILAPYLIFDAGAFPSFDVDQTNSWMTRFNTT